jgi:hypothetical protein
MDQSVHSISVTDTLYSLFDRAIQAEFSDVPEATVIIATSKVADYQCNSAMAISQVCLYSLCLFFYFYCEYHTYLNYLLKALKSRNQKISPVEVANRILKSLEKNDLIEKVNRNI